MISPDGKEDNAPISTIFSYSQMNKVTDCFLITDWILSVPVNQSQNITTNNFIVKHEEDLRLVLQCSLGFGTAEIKRTKSYRYDQTDFIKKQNV